MKHLLQNCSFKSFSGIFSTRICDEFRLTSMLSNVVGLRNYRFMTPLTSLTQHLPCTTVQRTVNMYTASKGPHIMGILPLACTTPVNVLAINPLVLLELISSVTSAGSFKQFTTVTGQLSPLKAFSGAISRYLLQRREPKTSTSYNVCCRIYINFIYHQ